MGILNCTPDSFFDQGRYFSLDAAIERGKQILDEGADIIDVGGVSTRPGAENVPYEEEKKRVLPVIKELAPYAKEHGKIISIDTNSAHVAQEAVSLGCTLINDVYGFEDPQLRQVAKDTGVKMCVMHMLGNPKTMQENPFYPKGVVLELKEWFEKKIHDLLHEGIKSSQIILDPGIGFGKTVQDNLTILKNITSFTSLGFPLLIGLSRKSFQSKILQKPSTQLLSTTIALNTMSVLEGAQIIRVHDVKEHRDVLDLLSALEVD